MWLTSTTSARYSAWSAITLSFSFSPFSWEFSMWSCMQRTEEGWEQDQNQISSVHIRIVGVGDKTSYLRNVQCLGEPKTWLPQLYNEWDSLLFTMPQWLYLFRLKSAIWTWQKSLFCDYCTKSDGLFVKVQIISYSFITLKHIQIKFTILKAIDAENLMVIFFLNIFYIYERNVKENWSVAEKLLLLFLILHRKKCTGWKIGLPPGIKTGSMAWSAIALTARPRRPYSGFGRPKFN